MAAWVDIAWMVVGASALWIGYAVAGYPLLALGLARLARPGPAAPARAQDSFVSVVIAAHAEGEALEARIENALGCGHPRDRIEVVIATDGPDVRAERLASEAASVRVVRLARRVGKTRALDEAVRHARGDVLVFTDATTRFRPDTLARLLAPFADPRVGCASGRLAYASRRADGSVLHAAFRRFEDRVRRAEAALGYVPSVSGALHAMRRDLYRPAPPDATRDLVDPAQVAALGARVAFDPHCVADEIGPSSAREGLRARRRMTLRGLSAFSTAFRLLRDAGENRAAWQLVSHKLLRWLIWIPLALAWIAHAAIALIGDATPALFASHSAFWVVSAASGRLAWSGRGGAIASALGFPVLTLVPMAGAAFDWSRGRRAAVWQPDRAPLSS